MPGDELVVDLNADLGEGFGAWTMGDDMALLQVVTSANVACGFHAGDPVIMRRVCATAAHTGIRVGAHVSYRDLAGFGRRDLAVPPEVLRDEVTYQIGALDAMARATGTRVAYVKAHGALYNRVVHDPVHAEALVQGVKAFGMLPLLGLPGSVLLDVASGAGLPAVAEAFPDRDYTAEGRLAPRHQDGAVIHDPETVAARAVEMASHHKVRAADGSIVAIDARSLCVHGDTPGAAEIARRTRAALLAAGVTLAPFA
ncbi:MAG TPA: 5-oxoprolinase subunit PxpA [Acidimicrobiales bacterium]|nr:5-oxoprolinase subunit PxpA [Acidimicrobiales bacterium]